MFWCIDCIRGEHDLCDKPFCECGNDDHEEVM